MRPERSCACGLLILGLLTAAHAAPKPVIGVADTAWSLVGRLRYSGVSSPDLTSFRIALAGDGKFTYEIEDDQGQTVSYTGFWLQKKRKVTLTFDEASRRQFEDAMALDFLNVGFRVDFDIQKWQVVCAVKGTQEEPVLKFKYRFKSRYVFRGKSDVERSFGFNFTIRGVGNPS